MDPLLRYALWGGFFAVALAAFVNTVAVPPVITLFLLFIVIGVPTTLGLRADSKRRGIPTRF